MPPLSEKTGQAYWRSLNEYAQTPEFIEFMHREFPAGATDLLEGEDRRTFLKIMGASLALAGMGLSGCRRWPDEKIAPYASRPVGRSPGVPVQYATSMELNGVAGGLLVTSFDGRPIKIEGNPQHSINAGASSVFEQASVLDLYDPDRSKSVLHKGNPSDWERFAQWFSSHASTLGDGSGLRILSEASGSPSVADMRRRVKQRFPRSTWHEYEPLNNDNVLAGSQIAFGGAYRAHYDFSKADVVVSLDSDFLGGSHPAWVKHARDFAARRRRADDDHTMSRLYAIESALSLTGINADHRVAVKTGDVSFIAGWLAAHILGEPALQAFTTSERGNTILSGETRETLEHAVEDLKGGQGRVIVIAGPRQPAEVHMLAHLMNESLGGAETVSYTRLPEAVPNGPSLQALCDAMGAGSVNTLLIIGGNPVYNAPVDLDFATRLGQVEHTIHLSHYVDETSDACEWHINRAHYLEAWGDGRSYDGTITLCQPLIEPLFSGKSTIELLSVVIGDLMPPPEPSESEPEPQEDTGPRYREGYDIVRRAYAERAGGRLDEKAWRRVLHDGFIPGTADAPVRASSTTGTREGAVTALFATWNATSGQEVTFLSDPKLYDGRYANNGWLQELPDPISKLTWDNAALMNPTDAAALGVTDRDMVLITAGDRSVTMPVLRSPGQAAGSVAVALGYGRSMDGRICPDAGFNTYLLRRTDAMGYARASISKASGTYPLATTQDHHAIDANSTGGKGLQERLPTLVREATLAEYIEHEDFVQHRTHVTHRLSLWNEDHPFQEHDGENDPDYAWAMSIDLNACTGCSACVVACQAENNIPIVGKDQVLRGRELHWIRLDRYYKFGQSADGSWDTSRLDGVAIQPVNCMHCENAPCEEVCPVAATTHDRDGLNVMVYNRCVGTRYCSNNCPYKVRRFNYFDYHRRKPHREQPGTFLQVDPEYYTKAQATDNPLKSMQFNPEVTVRMRGIMEKCTYCVQRISAARIEAKNNWVRSGEASHPTTGRPIIPDGTITPACAQACPSQAIVFGDRNDPNSRVAKLQQKKRSYQMLEELNVKARTRYLAKLRNPVIEPAAVNGEGAGHG